METYHDSTFLKIPDIISEQMITLLHIIRKQICIDSSALKTQASLLRTRRESSTKTQDEKTHSCLEGFCRKAAICSRECQKMQPKFRRQKNSQHLHLKILAAAFETDLTDYSPLCSSSYTVCTYSSIHQFSINQVSSLWCLSQWTLNTTGTHPTIRLQKG